MIRKYHNYKLQTNPWQNMMVKSDVYTRICTQVTFDLILGLWDISRLGIPHILLKTHQGTL